MTGGLLARDCRRREERKPENIGAAPPCEQIMRAATVKRGENSAAGRGTTAAKHQAKTQNNAREICFSTSTRRETAALCAVKPGRRHRRRREHASAHGDGAAAVSALLPSPRRFLHRQRAGGKLPCPRAGSVAGEDARGGGGGVQALHLPLFSRGAGGACCLGAAEWHGPYYRRQFVKTVAGGIRHCSLTLQHGRCCVVERERTVTDQTSESTVTSVQWYSTVYMTVYCS